MRDAGKLPRWSYSLRLALLGTSSVASSTKGKILGNTAATRELDLERESAAAGHRYHRRIWGRQAEALLLRHPNGGLQPDLRRCSTDRQGHGKKHTGAGRRKGRCAAGDGYPQAEHDRFKRRRYEPLARPVRRVPGEREHQEGRGAAPGYRPEEVYRRACTLPVLPGDVD